MQPLSGNQRPDLLTSLVKMSLVLRLPRKMHLCKSSSNAPRLPSILEMQQNPHVLLTFWQGAQSLAPAMRNEIWTSKSGPNMWCFNILTWKCASRYNDVHFFDRSIPKSSPKLRCFLHFDLAMCFAPQRRALFRHLNFQKWSEHGVLCILTSKCASCHNGVHFFDISTSKSGLSMVCFIPLGFEMCFAPQRRALFRHLNFQKCYENGVLSTFRLRHASRHNVVQFFISHLARWLRTRRFSEHAFRPSGATNHWKNTVNRDFSNFRRTCIFFPLTLSLLWSSFFFSSLLWLFPPGFSICPYCRKFDF